MGSGRRSWFPLADEALVLAAGLALAGAAVCRRRD